MLINVRRLLSKSYSYSFPAPTTFPCHLLHLAIGSSTHPPSSPFYFYFYYYFDFKKKTSTSTKKRLSVTFVSFASPPLRTSPAPRHPSPPTPSSGKSGFRPFDLITQPHDQSARQIRLHPDSPRRRPTASPRCRLELGFASRTKSPAIVVACAHRRRCDGA